MPVQLSKSEMLDTLRSMLRDVIHLRREGAVASRLARSRGYLDGYMRALLEGGVADQAELLRVVNEVRADAEGPATGPVSAEIAAA